MQQGPYYSDDINEPNDPNEHNDSNEPNYNSTRETTSPSSIMKLPHDLWANSNHL